MSGLSSGNLKENEKKRFLYFSSMYNTLFPHSMFSFSVCSKEKIGEPNAVESRLIIRRSVSLHQQPLCFTHQLFPSFAPAFILAPTIFLLLQQSDFLQQTRILPYRSIRPLVWPSAILSACQDIAHVCWKLGLALFRPRNHIPRNQHSNSTAMQI